MVNLMLFQGDHSNLLSGGIAHAKTLLQMLPTDMKMSLAKRMLSKDPGSLPGESTLHAGEDKDKVALHGGEDKDKVALHGGEDKDKGALHGGERKDKVALHDGEGKDKGSLHGGEDKAFGS